MDGVSQSEKGRRTAGKRSHSSDKALRLLVDQLTDYAMFLLTPEGEVATWNPGAQRIKGFSPQEIVGRHFRNFYPLEDQQSKKPERELEEAAAVGRFEDEGWRIRKDGSRFWANVIITAIREPNGSLLGFGKVTRDLTERKWSEEQLRNLSRDLMKMQDQERGRLGRELHDNFGQYLAAVKMSLEGILSGTYAGERAAREHLEECTSLVDRAIKEVRTLSYLLYPPMLDERGLSAAIRWHLEGFSKRSGIELSHRIEELPRRLQADTELALFRVLQESLTNVHRHAHTAAAQVRFAIEDGFAVLEITDQGVGMTPELELFASEPQPTLGVGIRGMRERVRQLGGTLDIHSTADGTTVKARVRAEFRNANVLTQEGH